MKAKKFRKKTVVIEAMQIEREDVCRDILGFTGGYSCGQGVAVCFKGDDLEHVEIDTFEGTMIAKEGDWIIKGVEGGFYPITDAILRKTHEVVE